MLNFFMEYKAIINLYENIPLPLAYELQHALTHLYFTSIAPDIIGIWHQYRLATEHLRRGILDGYKLYIFTDSFYSKELPQIFGEDGIQKKLAYFIETRQREFTDIENQSSSAADLTFHALERYRTIVHSSHSTSITLPENINSQGGVANKELICYYKIFCKWSMHELALSAVTKIKDIGILEDLINSFFNGLSIKHLETSIKKIQCRFNIATIQLLKKHGNLDLLRKNNLHDLARSSIMHCEDIEFPGHKIFMEKLTNLLGISLDCPTAVTIK